MQIKRVFYKLDSLIAEGLIKDMMYLLAILLPPVAVLFTGRPIQAVLNFILTLCFWLPGAVHAILVVHEHKADKRMIKQAKIMRNK